MSAEMARAYVRLRLENPELGANEAALEVGYAGGRPSPAARRLWERATLILEAPEILKALGPEQARLEAQIERAEARLAEAREKLRAQRDWRAAAKILAETQGVVSG